ncbi:MAG: M23 family metallopeptidase [Clostridia bacterium]|nr:M23 family metallopeptidase [Clostridia bacterium]
MDYDEGKHGGEMSKSGFITVIVICLLAIGAVSYFAIAGMKAKVKEKDKTSSDNKTYSSYDDSYNSSTDEPKIDIDEPSSSVGKTESDIPYKEPEKPAEQTKQIKTFILPVEGNVSKGFNDSALQYSATYGDMRLHTGIDILCNTGTDIKSAADGTVVSVEESATLGRVVTVDHGGDITVKYCGFESLNVKEGDSVKCGDVLGTSGTVPSEANDQPHIHIELLQGGNTVSPLEIFGDN